MPDQIRPPQVANTEDPFEVLRASKDFFLRRLKEIVSKAGVGKQSLLAAFGREVGDAYDQLASASPRDDFDEAGNLTASRLTLMSDHELEVDIHIRDICGHLRDAGGRDLWRSQLRYMTLLRRPKMKDAGNPVGPDVIGLGLWAICKEDGGDLAPILALLDRIEERLRLQLPVLYREVDELLAAHGVAPAQAQHVPVTANTNLGAQSAGGDGQHPTNPLATLQQAMRQRHGAEQQPPFGQPLIPFSANSEARSENPALDAAAMVMLKHLFDRLTALEARSEPVGAVPAGNDPASRPPLCVLKSKDLDLPLGKPEAITLDTLALIFEAMFESTDLPDTIKAAIGRLQIPLLKLAIVDSSLFADSSHPARLLINRMARAAIGLPPSTGSEHPVCKSIAALTAAVRDTLSQKGALLDPYLAELDALIAQRDQKLRLAAAGHVLLVVGHEKEQAAQQLANSWLRASLAKTTTAPIAAFLEKHWSRVMVAAAVAGGVDGARWQHDSATASELIWSVQPKASAEERKRLAGVASSLIRRIGAGLDEIAVSGPERTLFLNTLFDLQTAALRAPAATVTEPPDDPADQQAASCSAAESGAMTSAGPRTLGGDGLRVLYFGQSASAPGRRSEDNWQVGDWLRFCVPDHPELCGLCCWQSPSSATSVLFNPDWGYAVAIPRGALDEQLRAGRAQVASRTAIFDAAAERAMKHFEST